MAEHRRVVHLARCDRIVIDDIDAVLLQARDGVVRQALRVDGVVIDDGGRLGVQVVGDERGGERPLLVVAPDGAEDVVIAHGGELRVRRRIEHIGDSGAVKRAEFRQGGAGAVAAGDHGDAGIDQLLGGLHTLLGVAGVILGHDLELLAEHAAASIDLGGGHLGGVQDVDAGIGIGAG